MTLYITRLLPQERRRRRPSAVVVAGRPELVVEDPADWQVGVRLTMSPWYMADEGPSPGISPHDVLHVLPLALPPKSRRAPRLAGNRTVAAAVDLDVLHHYPGQVLPQIAVESPALATRNSARDPSVGRP